MTIVARGYTAFAQALHQQGFFLFADLPAGTTITRKRGYFVVRLP